MGLGAPLSVGLADVSRSRELRLDPHHFVLLARITPFIEALGADKSVPLDTDVLSDVTNGVNLPEKTYEPVPTETDFLYISVASLSQFALRSSRGVFLRDPDEFSYPVHPSKLVTRPDDVLVTRSGTPGIAWPASVWKVDSPALIPSGFLMRLGLRSGSPVRPVFLAAIMNHPVWRLWTASLAAGKRQRNLTQKHLAEIRIPVLSYEAQREVEDAYLLALNEIDTVLRESETISSLCDQILRAESDLNFESLTLTSLTFDTVHLAECWGRSGLRIDPRYHREEVRKVVKSLAGVEVVPLARLLARPILKSGQPVILAEEDFVSETRVVATVSLQAGQVVHDLTKPTTDDEISAAGERLIQQGDVLVAMDGEGSIGKAALFLDDYQAVTDSHVAILRLADPEMGSALVCYLNSSLGRAQVELATSGATGQTQLAKADLGAFIIPQLVLERSQKVKVAFRAALTAYEPVPRRVRRRLCEAEVMVSHKLIELELLQPKGQDLVLLSSTDGLLSLLDELRPEMF